MPPLRYKPRWGEATDKVVFDTNGDLRLVVGPEQILFTVCSKSLARASRVFDRMLHGGFAESKPDGDVEWVVDLPEDDINGAHILMDIIHGNINNVPMSLHDNPGPDNSLDDISEILRGVALFADKHDIVHLLHPWAKSWLGDLRKGFHEDAEEDVGWRGNVISCAWVFGDEWLLMEELRQVVLNARLSTATPENNDLQVPEGHEATDDGEGSMDETESRREEEYLRKELSLVNAYKVDVSPYNLCDDENQTLSFFDPEQFTVKRIGMITAMLKTFETIITGNNERACICHKNMQIVQTKWHHVVWNCIVWAMMDADIKPFSAAKPGVYTGSVETLLSWPADFRNVL